MQHRRWSRTTATAGFLFYGSPGGAAAITIRDAAINGADTDPVNAERRLSPERTAHWPHHPGDPGFSPRCL